MRNHRNGHGVYKTIILFPIPCAWPIVSMIGQSELKVVRPRPGDKGHKAMACVFKFHKFHKNSEHVCANTYFPACTSVSDTSIPALHAKEGGLVGHRNSYMLNHSYQSLHFVCTGISSHQRSHTWLN